MLVLIPFSALLNSFVTLWSDFKRKCPLMMYTQRSRTAEREIETRLCLVCSNFTFYLILTLTLLIIVSSACWTMLNKISILEPVHNNKPIGAFLSNDSLELFSPLVGSQ